MLRQFAVYYRPWMGLFWLNFGCAVVSGLLELAFPLAVRDYIDWLLPQGNWTLTVIFAGVLCAIYVVNAGLMAIVIYWGHMLGINIETEMRRRAFDHLQRLSWGYFDRQHSGRLIARVTRDLEDIGEVAHHGPEDLIVAAMTFVGAFILMLTVHAPLTWMTVVIVPLAALLVMYFGGRLCGVPAVGGVYFRPLEKIGSVIETYPKGIAGFRRYLDLMASKPDVEDAPGAVAAPVLRGAVTFDHVSFGYDPARPVLRDVSFAVQPGQTVAFVGASGAEKPLCSHCCQGSTSLLRGRSALMILPCRI